MAVVKKPVKKAAPKKTVTKPARRHIKANLYQDWDLLTVDIAPAVLDSAIKFGEENRIGIGQLVTSAVKVFISEAEEYMAEQMKLKKDFFVSRELSRHSSSYTTADVIKEKHMGKYTDLANRNTRTNKK